MSIIKIENLSFSYPTSYDAVFENICFQIDTDWKLGLIGRNGRGKTTLLKLLLGQYEYSGRIIHSVTFDYFPYVVKDRSGLTLEVLEEICCAAEWELIRELSYLDVDAEVLWRPFETLSNGEQTKVLLAALFLNEGHFLLIDEPTNHLDMNARLQVAQYLKRKKGFILVSHDRNFLDECVDHILSINKTTIDIQSGNFSSWSENFERQQTFEKVRNDRLKKDIGRLQQSARRTSNWSVAVEKSKKGTRNSGSKLDKGYVGHQSAKMMQRSKSLESRQMKAIEEKSKLLKNTETRETLKIHPLQYHSDLLVSFSEIAVHYGKEPICKPVSFEIHQQECVILDGKNGSGKSSLLKLLTDDSIGYTGSLHIASGLILSYVPQEPPIINETLSNYAYSSHLDESLFKAILKKMGFERVQFEKRISEFSEGQKKKVQLAKSLCEQAHLYLWDEPLNFIDIDSRIQIETLIKDFSPTLLLVEHDRAFRESVATKTISL